MDIFLKCKCQERKNRRAKMAERDEKLKVEIAKYLYHKACGGRLIKWEDCPSQDLYLEEASGIIEIVKQSQSPTLNEGTLRFLIEGILEHYPIEYPPVEDVAKHLAHCLKSHAGEIIQR